MEFRYRTGAKVWDLVIGLLECVLGSALLFGVVLSLFPRLSNPGRDLIPLLWVTFGSMLIATWAVLACRRWWSFLRIDSVGLTFYRREGVPIADLRWDSIREIRRIVQDGMELCDGAARIRITDRFRDAEIAKPRALELAWNAVRRGLEEERGVVTFRMPGSPWAGHAVYLLIVAVLSVATAAAIGVISRHGWALDVAVGLVWYGILMVILLPTRSKAGWWGGRVILSSGGILVHRLDGERWMRWEEIRGTAWKEDDSLELILHGDERCDLPARLGNILHLEEFVQNVLERRRHAEV